MNTREKGYSRLSHHADTLAETLFAQKVSNAVIDNGIQRRLNMLRMFVRYYGERLLGIHYPDRANQIFAFLTQYEKQTLYRLARSLPPEAQLAEIGTYLGGSSCCLAAGITGRGSTLHCVDTFMSDHITGEERRDTYAQFVENTVPYQAVIQVHRGLSSDVVSQFSQPLDLLFVDGDHSWEGVTTDLDLYLPLLKDEGILIMHDSAHPPVRRAIEQYVLPREKARLEQLPNMYAARVRQRKGSLA